VRQATSVADARLARRLILDELFDLSLYKSLRTFARGDLARVLDELIPVETRHFAFWQDFFGRQVSRLDWGRRLKLALIVAVCRLLGAPAIHLVLEAIEVHGVRKYLHVWSRCGDTPLGGALREVLEDEFKHEDATVAGEAERRINPERPRREEASLPPVCECRLATPGRRAAHRHPGADALTRRLRTLHAACAPPALTLDGRLGGGARSRRGRGLM